MEARITLEIRSSDSKALAEKIGPLFGRFENMNADRLAEAFSSEQQDSIEQLIQSCISVIVGLEFVEIAGSKANAAFVGGWESEAFAARLARVIFSLGFDDFEIVTVEDESVCVTGVFEAAVVREYFESLDIYHDAGFQFPEMVTL